MYACYACARVWCVYVCASVCVVCVCVCVCVCVRRPLAILRLKQRLVAEHPRLGYIIVAIHKTSNFTISFLPVPHQFLIRKRNFVKLGILYKKVIDFLLKTNQLYDLVVSDRKAIGKQRKHNRKVESLALRVGKVRGATTVFNMPYASFIIFVPRDA